MNNNIAPTQFDWVTKGKSYSTDRVSDIHISIVNNAGKYKSGVERKALHFTFRNDVYKLITDTDFVIFATKKNRIYFASASNINGFKLSDNNTHSNRYMKCTIDEDNIDIYNVYVGDYELKYDEFNELYYIEKENFNG